MNPLDILCQCCQTSSSCLSRQACQILGKSFSEIKGHPAQTLVNREQTASLICGFIEIACALHEKELNPASLSPSTITDILRAAAKQIRELSYHFGESPR